MDKVKVANPVVELDGDEMTRVMWSMIRERVILPNVDIDLKYFDLGIGSREATRDRITHEAARAIAEHRVGIKCATITPDAARVKEFGLSAAYRSPNVTIRNALRGTIFREPIVCNNIPRLVPNWTEPIVIGRHVVGDIYTAAETLIPGPGMLRMRFEPEGGGEPIELDVCKFTEPGVALAMYNFDEAIRGFARACFNYGLSRRYPVYLSTKNTILKVYDGRFSSLFEEIFAEEFRDRFAAAGLTYEHRLTDDMAAAVLRSHGGVVWAAKGNDGDVQSDVVAQAFGSLGLMSSVMLTPDGKTVVAEAAHGTVTRHYRLHQQGKETSTNPIASIFAWTRGLAHRGRLDDNPELIWFSETLERVTVDLVESGKMTKDLAVLIGPDQPFLSTSEYLEAVAKELGRRMSLVASAMP